MSALLRFLIFAAIAVLVFRLLRRLLTFSAPDTKKKPDPEKEVRNATFREEDIQDAQFRDLP